MGFVGGSSNIATAPATCPTPIIFCVLYCKHKIVYGFSLFYFLCLPDASVYVETNPGPWRPVAAVCRILCSNVQGLAGNLNNSPWLRLSMIYCCAQRLWSQICITCQSYWFPGQDASGARDGYICTRWLRSIPCLHNSRIPLINCTL